MGYRKGFYVTYDYAVNGRMLQVTGPQTGHVLWHADETNARGQLTQFKLGNGLTTLRTYYRYGHPSAIKTGRQQDNYTGVQNLSYTFNTKTGNLMSRSDKNCNVTENFGYNDLLYNRLTSWQVDGQNGYFALFANNGNINQKTDVTSLSKGGIEGFYFYGNNAGLNAVTSIQNPTTEYSHKAQPQNISYTPFNKVSTAVQINKGQGKETRYGIDVTYGPDNMRKKVIFTKGRGVLKTKYYIGGNYEVEIDEKGDKYFYHYLFAENTIFAIYKWGARLREMNYIHTDYLGSYETVTYDDGQIAEKLSFDPWGRRRNPQDWTYNNVPATHLYDRGFTGHEHWDNLGLINMNGRVYDPRLGRFLSPDPIVQNPANTQSYNRYTYALNNPLKYTDPGGYYSGPPPYYEGDFEVNNWNAFDFAFTRVKHNYTQRYEYKYIGNGTYANYNITEDIYEEVSFDEVFNNFIAPNASLQIPTLEGKTILSISAKEFVFASVYEDEWGTEGYGWSVTHISFDNIKARASNNGMAGGGEGLTLSETNTMATVMGLTNTFTRSLINWGVRQATTPWGNSISGLNKFSKRSGKFLGYYSAFVYGIQARNAYNNGDRLNTLSNGLMSFYSIVSTQGDGAGFTLTLPLFIVDWTVGMDNFLMYNFNFGVEQSIQIQNGNWGVSIWRPGQGLR